MLATRARLNPWRARSRGASLGRVRLTWPSATAAAIPAGRVRCSSPRGPLTARCPPSTRTVTPWGIGTGFLPIRLTGPPLPDHGDEFAAQVPGPRLAVAHEAARGAHDRHAEAVAHPGNLARL